jgi:hypothetical protein
MKMKWCQSQEAGTFLGMTEADVNLPKPVDKKKTANQQ